MDRYLRPKITRGTWSSPRYQWYSLCDQYLSYFSWSTENMQALGMESGAITDSEITASTIFDVYHNSYRGRLHTKEESPYAKGGWSSLINDFHQWIRVDIGEIKKVTHIYSHTRTKWLQFISVRDQLQTATQWWRSSVFVLQGRWAVLRHGK